MTVAQKVVNPTWRRVCEVRKGKWKGRRKWSQK